VYSTEQQALIKIAYLLRDAGIPTSRLVDEIALLTAWARASDEAFGEVSWNEQQPDLRYAFTEMAKRLGEHGSVFEESRLLDSLSGSETNAILGCLKQLSGASGEALAKALVAIAEKVSHPGQMITMETGQFLADLCAPKKKHVVLNHEAAVPALVALEAVESVTMRMLFHSPYAISVSYLMGAEVEVGKAVGFAEAPTLSEVVISMPPLQATGFSQTSKLKSDELATIRVARECTSRGAVCVAPSVLFSRSSMKVREELINNNWLDAVIELPTGTLSNTALSPVILVIDKHREKDSPIAFVEVSEQQSPEETAHLVRSLIDRHEPKNGAFASNLDVQKNDYDLTISRYKPGLAAQELKRLKNTVLLDGVADVVRAQSLKDAEDTPGATLFLEASVRDISETGCLGTPLKKMHIDKKQFRRAQNQRIYPGDILLAIKGSVGRVAFVGEDCGDNWIAGQAFIIIRPKSASVSTPYLYRYLASELIQEYIQEVATGGVMALLKAAAVSDIPVPLPEPEVLKSVEETHQRILAEYEVIKKHRDTVSRLELKNWPLNAEKGASRV